MVLQNKNNRSFQPNPGFELTSSSGPMGTVANKCALSGILLILFLLDWQDGCQVISSQAAKPVVVQFRSGHEATGQVLFAVVRQRSEATCYMGSRAC